MIPKPFKGLAETTYTKGIQALTSKYLVMNCQYFYNYPFLKISES